MAEDRYLDPTRESFDAFKALPRDVPINMLNLLRFHEHAQYPEDHPNAGKGGAARAPMRNMARPAVRFSSGSAER
ncbi:hypothetical protein [Sphingopyxis sp. BSNA05]|uniref:hypothetical protein n=1 Tax=Sphingopyxis sp. BSNA05 TaxID=1236614 RepID=UPI00349F4753